MRHLGDTLGEAVTNRNKFIAQIKVERRIAGFGPDIFCVAGFGVVDARIKQLFAEARLLVICCNRHATQLNRDG